MEGAESNNIRHRMVKVNGISMHIAEEGKVGDPIILFLHGFPEVWYSWRHQLTALASRGYHTVAPDLRGYGETDSPTDVRSYTCHHIVGDLIALVDLLLVEGGGDEKKVFLVAHDWGAMIGWYLCLFRSDKFKAYVCLSVPFRPRHPVFKPVAALTAVFGEDYYMCRFQKPGEIEQEISKHGSKEILNNILSADCNPSPPILPKENPFGIFPNKSLLTLPTWLSEHDLNYYAAMFDKTGFTGALNYYRNLDKNWELTAPWSGAKIHVPVKFIAGEHDLVYNSPGIKDYVHKGGFKEDVPFLQDVVVMEGAGHYMNQTRPEEINNHIHDFISNF